MRILIIHNEYGRFSGEEAVVEANAALLKEHGHVVERVSRTSAEIMASRTRQIKAFFSGIHSPRSRRAVLDAVHKAKPDVAHVHNLYPLLSPSILPVLTSQGVPVVMTVHNYRLLCPNGLFLSGGAVCERCSGGREWWCALKNCERSVPKSVAYAVRNWAARVMGYYRKNVSAYAVLTEFQRSKLCAAGFPSDRMHLLPNCLSHTALEEPGNTPTGSYVAFIGRMSHEKGIDVILHAAKLCPDIPLRLAGSFERLPELPKRLPGNVVLTGHLSAAELRRHVSEARLLLFPSVWYEGFPMSLLDALAAGTPVVCSRIGGLPEIIEDGVTGRLFTAGDAQACARAIGELWSNPALARQMGTAGQQKTRQEYTPQRYYERLMATYDAAMANPLPDEEPHHANS